MTRPCLTERLLMGRKESNQTNKIKYCLAPLWDVLYLVWVVIKRSICIFLSVDGTCIIELLDHCKGGIRTVLPKT